MDNNKNNTFFVLGVGRSGTSTVARILHTHFNISMGEHFRQPDVHNINGYYEDLEFKNPNELLLSGRYSLPQWIGIIEREIKNRSGKKWGLKDPRLCYLLGFYICYIENPVYILCERGADAIADSMVKCYGWTRENALKMVIVRRQFLKRTLRDKKVLTINFREQRSDIEIITELEEDLCLS